MESEKRQKEVGKLPEKRTIKRKRIFSPENTPSSSPDQVQKRFKKVKSNFLINYITVTSFTVIFCVSCVFAVL